MNQRGFFRNLDDEKGGGADLRPSATRRTFGSSPVSSLMTLSKSKISDEIFSCLTLAGFDKSKNLRFFSCFKSDDFQQIEDF
jgi:hypothetical protein